jgi:hypothetical protein
MFKFKKDRVLLLKALRELVAEDVKNSSIDPFLEEDVSDFLADMRDKKRIRRLKEIQKALNEWIPELVSQEKVREEERQYNRESMKNATKLVERD